MRLSLSSFKDHGCMVNCTSMSYIEHGVKERAQLKGVTVKKKKIEIFKNN